MSIDDSIDLQMRTLRYMYIMMGVVAQAAAKLGRGSLLAKADIEFTYQLIPVHPNDRPLLAICWGSGALVDAMLE